MVFAVILVLLQSVIKLVFHNQLYIYHVAPIVIILIVSDIYPLYSQVDGDMAYYINQESNEKEQNDYVNYLRNILAFATPTPTEKNPKPSEK